MSARALALLFALAVACAAGVATAQAGNATPRPGVREPRPIHGDRKAQEVRREPNGPAGATPRNRAGTLHRADPMGAPVEMPRHPRGMKPPAGSHEAQHGVHGTATHGGHAAATHGLGKINLFTGLVGESDTEPPGLLWRRPGTPPPLGAALINLGILAYVVVRVGGPKIAEGLKKRRATILKGMEEAAAMRAEAEGQLAGYQAQLDHIDDEVARVRREMKDAAEAERRRVLAEASDRKERMVRDAKILVEQERKAAHEHLMRETVASAVKSAEELLSKGLSDADEVRLGDEFLTHVARVAPAAGAVR